MWSSRPSVVLVAAPVLTALGVLVALGVVRVEVASSSPPAPQEVRTPSWQERVSAFRDAHPDVVLPQQLPDDVVDVTPVVIEGQPAVDVFTGSGPSVTVCSGDTSRCRRALPDAPLVRTGAVGATAYVVLVNPTKDPAGRPTLGEQAAFWAGVALDTARPRWLDGASAPD